MTDDLIEHAEGFLTDPESDMVHADRVVRELLAALKTVTAERDRLRESIVYVPFAEVKRYD
jgi:hypothetical protein